MFESWACFVISSALMWFLVLDPIGNLPLFISILRECDAVRYRRVVVREGGMALGILLLCLLFGEGLLKLLRISAVPLEIAGGVILFLIALRMVFGLPQPGTKRNEQEPYMVPLAVPLFAGPSAVTVSILIRGSTGATLYGCVTALLLAWSGAMLVLLSGRAVGRKLGKPGLEALESLSGLLLTVMAVEMMLRGFHAAFPAGG